MKNFPLTAALVVLLTSAAPAFASDLSDDLRTPFEPLSNPFGQAQASPLSSQVAQELKAVLEGCAYSPVHHTSRIPLIEMAALRSGCEGSVKVALEVARDGKPVIGHWAQVRTPHFQLQVVSWDGSNSDGGDEQAIGVYDLSGQRVAIYPALYGEGNVLDGLAHAVGAALSSVEI